MTTTSSKARDIADQINAHYKKDVVTLASDPVNKVRYSKTGLLPFDILLPGGLPKGRMVEIYGGPSSLKSYFLLCAIAEVQREGGTCALLDTERTFDPEWAALIGVDLEKLIIPDVPTGERAFDIAQILVENEIDLLGFDSIAAAQPQTYDDNPLEDSKIQPGRHAALFSLGLRKVTSKNTKTTILFTNQTRTSIGITFGNPTVTPGGNAPAFYASLRMHMIPAGKIHEAVKSFDGDKWVDAKRQIAQKFRVEMTKSKLSSPYGQVVFDWNLTNGEIDMPRFLRAQGMELGIIKLSGQTWSYGDISVRGKDNFLDAIAADENLRRQLEWDIRKHHGLITADTTRKTRIVRSASPGKVAPSPVPKKRVVVKRKRS